MELFLIIATGFIYFGRKAYIELRWVQQILNSKYVVVFELK